jgi:TPP-dependent 2-oxoacid decarboxylase
MNSTIVLNQIFKSLSQTNLQKIELLFSDYPQVFEENSKLILHHTLALNDFEMFIGVTPCLKLNSIMIEQALSFSIQNHVSNDIIELIEQLLDFHKAHEEKKQLEKNIEHHEESQRDKKEKTKI